MTTPRPIFYDDDVAAALDGTRASIFLAGPTQRSRTSASLTPWRARAVALLATFDGHVVIPEFRDRDFDVAAKQRFGAPASPSSTMKATSFNILTWETHGIEHATAVLFWMPFAISDDDASLPGFTTRAEVAREMVRSPARIVLGMPAQALSSSHIRYHAHHAGIPIHNTLEAAVAAALVVTRGTFPVR